jgi:hypothetical protein
MQMSSSKTEGLSEQFQQVMELRCRQEILQRWLASEVLTDGLQQSLRAMLGEVEERLRAMSIASDQFNHTLD